MLQIGQQVEYLCLDGDVKRRHGLVSHHHRWIEHERASNGNALALATRKHVRVTVVVFRSQADQCQHGAGLFSALLRPKGGIDLQRCFQNLPDALARVE